MVSGRSGKHSLQVTQSDVVSNFDFQPPLTLDQFAHMPVPPLKRPSLETRHLSAIQVLEDRISRVSFFNNRYELEGEDLYSFARHVVRYLGDSAVSLSLSTHYTRKID